MKVMTVILCKLYLCEFLCMLDTLSQGEFITRFEKQVQRIIVVLYNGQWNREQLNDFLLDKIWHNRQK
jgi:hypothetical protein